MGSPLFKSDILFVQRLLSSAGLYKGPLDGKFNQAHRVAVYYMDLIKRYRFGRGLADGPKR